MRASSEQAISAQTETLMRELPSGPSLPQGFLLASALTGYPGPSFPAHVQLLLGDAWMEPAGASAGMEAWQQVCICIGARIEHAEALDDLRSDYIDLFDRGLGSSPLYETEYGRDRAMRKAAELVDLAGFYRAFGLETQTSETHEMLDHISVELEFYGVLLMKEHALLEAGNQEGVEIVGDARRKFLREHLGRFPAAICERPGVTGHSFYRPVFTWCAALVAEECRREQVSPIPLSWISGQQESEEVACGATVGGIPGGAPSPQAPPAMPV